MTVALDRPAGGSSRARLATLTAEDRLVLAAARSQLRRHDRQTIAELVAGVDWSYVLDVGVRHGVGPLLRHGLSGFTVPEQVRGRLDDLYESSRLRNDRLFAALGEVVGELRAAGVSVIGLKDAQLAVDVYPERALRPMGDIDVLIRRADYDRVAAKLDRLGFVPLPQGDVPYTRRYAMGQHFRRAADEIWLDVQWNIAQRAWDASADPVHTYRIGDLWATASPLVVDGYELLAPSPEHMLLHLCLHLEGHEYSELILFCDIVELLRQYDGRLDWDAFAGLTRAQHAASSVYHVLMMVERLFGVGVPGGLLEQLESPYFAGALFRPIFGNLTSLHSALDEIALAASPLEETLDELEAVARRQAARAKALYDHVDRVAAAFVDNGGKVIAFVGGPSPRGFPDAAQQAFGDLQALVLDEDIPLLGETLAATGFSNDGCSATLTIPVETADPVLADDRSSLTLAVDFTSTVGLREVNVRSSSNKEAALDSIKARLSSRPRDDHAVAWLRVAGLTQEGLLRALAQVAVLRQEGRLFGLCSMLHAAGRVVSPLEPVALAGPAPRDDGVGAMIATLVALLRPHERARLGAEQLAEDRPSPLLEWARYGPGSFDRYPLLRPLYYVALCFLVAAGPRAKARYVARVLRTRVGRRHVPGHLVGAPRRRRLRTAQPLSYWADAVEARRDRRSEGWGT